MSNDKDDYSAFEKPKICDRCLYEYKSTSDFPWQE